MTTRLVKFGNSQGVCLAKPILQRLGLESGDSFEVEITDEGALMLIPLEKPVRSRYKLNDLLKGDVEAEELDWGTPVGKEAW